MEEREEIETTEEEGRDEHPFCDSQLASLLNKGPLLTFAEQTRYWLTGFNSTAGITLVRLNKRGAIELHIFFDKRYIHRAKKEIGGARIRFYESLDDFIKFVRQQEFHQILIEGEYTNLKDVKQIQNWVGPFCKIIEITGQELRRRKSVSEIRRIEEAVKISLTAFKDIRSTKLKIGVSESDVAKAMTIRMLELGADSEAFPPIVAFGKNTANPHHKPGETKLKAGDIVTIDFGAKFAGYCADITRTFLYPGVSNNDEFKRSKLARIYQVVERAASLGRAAVRPGVKASDIHKICADHIASEGYLDNFLHGTGHGVGLDIHEKPNVAPGDDSLLESGNVITVEPGIYIEGLGGVRIEDTIVVVESGSRILSRPYLCEGQDYYPSHLDEFTTSDRVETRKLSPKKRSENLEKLFETYERAFGEGRISQSSLTDRTKNLRARYGEDYPKNLVEFVKRNHENRLPNLAPSEESVYLDEGKKLPCCYFQAKFGGNNRRIFAYFSRENSLSKELQPARSLNAQRFRGNPRWWDNRRKSDIWRVTERINRFKRSEEVVTKQEQTKELPLDGPTNPSSGLRNEVIEKIEKTQELAPKRRGRPPKVRIDLDSGTNPTNNLVETTETLRPRRGRPPKLATSLGSELLTPILTTRKRGRPRKITNLEHDIREENS